MAHPLHRFSAVAIAAALTLGATACGTDPAKPSPSASPTVPAYLPVPSGVDLTVPGTALKIGQHAVIAWRPNQREVAALDVRVRRLERTTYDKSFQGWAVSPDQAATTPYFARVTVKNVSTSDLGGLPVPIVAQMANGVSAAAQPFAQRTFTPCHPTVLPKKFAAGATAELCFVFPISPGQDLAAIAFQPQGTDGFLKSVTWTGKATTKVLPPKPKATKKAKATKKPKKSPSSKQTP